MLIGVGLLLAVMLIVLQPGPTSVPDEAKTSRAHSPQKRPDDTARLRAPEKGENAPQGPMTALGTAVKEGADDTEVGSDADNGIVTDPPKAPVMGSLTRTEIDDGIREVMPDILDCYQALIEEVPEMLGGRIDVKFTIADEDGIGRMARVQIVDAEFDDIPMEECLLDALEDVHFPSPGGGIVIVRYPFSFSSE